MAPPAWNAGFSRHSGPRAAAVRHCPGCIGARCRAIPASEIRPPPAFGGLCRLKPAFQAACVIPVISATRLAGLRPACRLKPALQALYLHQVSCGTTGVRPLVLGGAVERVNPVRDLGGHWQALQVVVNLLVPNSQRLLVREPRPQVLEVGGRRLGDDRLRRAEMGRQPAHLALAEPEERTHVHPAVAELGEEPDERLGGVVRPHHESAREVREVVLHRHPHPRLRVSPREVAERFGTRLQPVPGQRRFERPDRPADVHAHHFRRLDPRQHALGVGGVALPAVGEPHRDEAVCPPSRFAAATASAASRPVSAESTPPDTASQRLRCPLATRYARRKATRSRTSLSGSIREETASRLLRPAGAMRFRTPRIMRTCGARSRGNPEREAES